MHRRAAFVFALLLTGPCLLVSAFAVSPVSADVLAVSTFDSDTQGWTAVTVDAAGNANPSTVFFAPGLGTPGGALRHNAPSDSRTSYFLAPANFIAALHGAVGGLISWDISTIKEASDIFDPEVDIEIRAGVNRISRGVTPPEPPASPSYVRNTLTFAASAGWLFFDGANTTPATQPQIDSVLSGADRLLIRAEYFFSFNPDTALLDNPVVAGPGLGVVLNRYTAVAGDFVQMRTVSGLGQVVDLYVVVALPLFLSPGLGCGGSLSLIFISNGGSTQTLACASSPPSTYPRYTGSTTVPAGPLFGVQWSGAAPPGTYIFAAVATLPGALADGVLNPGDIVAQSIAQLTVP